MNESGEIVERKVLEFFNSASSPIEIRDQIQDDPNFGSSFKYGVTVSTAKRILTERDETLGGHFSSIEQIDSVPGVGPSTLHNILYTFQNSLLEDSQLIFLVTIDGILREPYSEIEGLESKTEILKYENGNDLRQRKRPGGTSFSNLVLRRNYLENIENRKLWDWRKKVIEGVIERKGGSIIISDQYKNEYAQFNFFEAWPCRWEIKIISSKNGHLMPVEEIELVIEKLEH